VFLLRLSFLYRMPVRSLMRELSRADVLDLMAYDIKYGLPDRGDAKLPAAPVRRRTRDKRDPMKVFQWLKKSFGK